MGRGRGRGPGRGGRWWGRGPGPGLRRISGFLEPALLLLLHRGRSHGYDLSQGLRELGLGESAGFDMSTVYRSLRAMEDQGYVTSTWATGGIGPARRLYTLTPEGDLYLSLWVADLEATRKMLDLFITEYENHMTEEHPSGGLDQGKE